MKKELPVVRIIEMKGFKTVKVAGKVCYADQIDQINFDDIPDSYVNKLTSLGHMSPFEHFSVSFLLTGVSRSLTHQLVRHRIASYSQRSQRYVSEFDFRYITPAPIERKPWIENMYKEFLREAEIGYTCTAMAMLLDDVLSEMRKIEGVGPEGYADFEIKYQEEINYAMRAIKEKVDTDVIDAVSEVVEKSLAHIKPKTMSHFRKKAYENARYLLPNAVASDIVVTMNGRALVNFLNERMCLRAQDEIRVVAAQMLAEIGLEDQDAWSMIRSAGGGPKCVALGFCPEGSMSCGLYPTKEQVIKR